MRNTSNKNSNTEKTPKRKAGKGAMNGFESSPGFSKYPQPTSQQKKDGWAKRRAGRMLIEDILSSRFNGNLESKLLDQMSQYYNVPKEQITVEMMMNFRQIEKAIQKADTAAYNTVMDRIYGKANQPLTGADEEPLIPQGKDERIDAIIEKLNALG